MGRIKTACTCNHCGMLFTLARAELGYTTCTTCGELEARSVRHTVVPMNKSNYIVVSDLKLLTQLNPKRT